jgi:multiple sugar transport system permease protein
LAAVAPRRRWQDTFEERRFLAPLLIAPAVVFIFLLVGLPLALAIYISLTDATAGSLSGDFVGLRNYTDAWDDENFRRALRNSIIFPVVSQAIVLVGAGFLAHALVRNFRGKWILRFLVLLPWAAPVSLSTVGFLWIFHSLYSVVNWTLTHDIVPGSPAFYPYRALNWAFARDFWPSAIQITPIEPIDPPQWLGEPNLAMAAIILIHAWRIIPFATVIFIAGLASMPPEIVVAA